MPFTLLIPDARDRVKADRALQVVLSLMGQAAGTPVKGLVDGPDPFESVQRVVQEGSFDEIIVSTLPRRASQWLRRDLITRVEGGRRCVLLSEERGSDRRVHGRHAVPSAPTRATSEAGLADSARTASSSRCSG